MGDVHPLGNPHYWLDPENGRRMAKAIAEKFSELRPQDASYFAEHEADFERRLTEAEKRWDAQMAPYHGRKVITYHPVLAELRERDSNLDVIGYVETKPGIPPRQPHSRRDQHHEARRCEADSGRALFRSAHAELNANALGGEVLVAAAIGGGVKEVNTYFELFDYDINLLTRPSRKKYK